MSAGFLPPLLLFLLLSPSRGTAPPSISLCKPDIPLDTDSIDIVTPDIVGKFHPWLSLSCKVPAGERALRGNSPVRQLFEVLNSTRRYLFPLSTLARHVEIAPLVQSQQKHFEVFGDWRCFRIPPPPPVLNSPALANPTLHCYHTWSNTTTHLTSNPCAFSNHCWNHNSNSIYNLQQNSHRKSWENLSTFTNRHLNVPRLPS